ncbi:MAG: S8 family serine peptidase, partial [Gemmatimonadota bacterium]
RAARVQVPREAGTNRWMRRIRGAVGMGLTWAAGWALVGVLIGLSWSFGLPMEWFVEVFDAPLPALAIPGFVGGTVFSMVLGIAGGRRRFAELSLPRFGAWGAVGGLLLGLFPSLVGVSGGTVSVAAAAGIIGTLTLLSAVSASGSLALARTAEERQLLDAGADVAEVERTGGEAQKRLGGRIRGPFGAVLAVGVFANIAYTLGSVVEVTVNNRWGRKLLPVGPVLFRQGVLFSVGLTLVLPTIILTIHAAGNDGSDLEVEDNFPTPVYDDGGRAANWVAVGASGWKVDSLATSFPNYGQTKVDVFAPDLDILSAAPGDEWETQQGTSMAAPVVTGVAALLMAYFPELTAADVKDILLASSVKYADRMVPRPGDPSPTGEPAPLVRFGELSVSGGVVNAYEAVRLALEREKR